MTIIQGFVIRASNRFGENKVSPDVDQSDIFGARVRKICLSVCSVDLILYVEHC